MRAILQMPRDLQGHARYLPMIALMLPLASCANKAPPQGVGGPRRVEDMVARVVRVYPHDARAFTQGLVYFDGGVYESTGLAGRSSIRRVDPDSGTVLAEVSLEPQYFGEGLARVGDELIQLTWKNRRAFVWKLSTFQPVRQHSYEGEGWGLCYDGKRLIMSDGSDRLTFRDPRRLRRRGQRSGDARGPAGAAAQRARVRRGLVYANIWGTDYIARIDPDSGEVTGWIDASVC